MGGEPAIVVERRKELTYLLCRAAELEHAVVRIPVRRVQPQEHNGPGLRDDQLGAVEGWRGVLFAIAKRKCCTGPWSRTCSRQSGLPTM
jgi:hypothetical protein